MPHPVTDYERSDASPRTIAIVAGTLVLTVAFVFSALAFSFRGATQDRHKGPDGALPPQPRLQTDVTLDEATTRAGQAERLARFGWVEAPGGAVHIPIDRAIRITAERGIPSWPSGR
jgi:hypothetical protein